MERKSIQAALRSDYLVSYNLVMQSSSQSTLPEGLRSMLESVTIVTVTTCRDGGIGIHTRLKILPSKEVAGSSPAPGTNYLSSNEQLARNDD